MYYVLLYYTNDFNHKDPSKTFMWHGGIPLLTSVFITIIGLFNAFIIVKHLLDRALPDI